MQTFDAFIAAGGFAERLGGNGPKSLLTIDGTSMLELTVRGALSAGARKAYVLTNRLEFIAETERAVSSLRDVIVVPDMGFSSTLQLAREMRITSSVRTLFLYGHAPRPISLLNEIAQQEGEVTAYAFSRSSRRRPIARGERLLEPPFLIETQLLDTREDQWCNFFTSLGSRVRVLDTDDEPEFNLPDEANLYLSYVSALGLGAFGTDERHGGRLSIPPR
jgi:CTP:molybdopterin cytidylyltransferase MocA